MMDQILSSAATASRKAWEVHWEKIQSASQLLSHGCFHRFRLLLFTALCLVSPLTTSLHSLNYMEETIVGGKERGNLAA